MQKLKIWLLSFSDLQPWLAGVLVVLSSAWVADALREGLEPLARTRGIPGWLIALFYLVILVAALAWLYHTRRALFRPRTRYLNDRESPEPRQYLILFLSDLYISKDEIQEGIPEWLELSADIEADLRTMEALKKANRQQQWRWEMPLRALKHHASALKQVILICSDNSIKQVHWFYKIVRRYPVFKSFEVMILVNEAAGTELTPCYEKPRQTGGWDFERFDSLSTAMLDLFKIFKKQHIPEKQIMIDFTGGQKVTSVVAAAVSFNRESKAQYVQTNAPWNIVSYDVR